MKRFLILIIPMLLAVAAACGQEGQTGAPDSGARQGTPAPNSEAQPSPTNRPADSGSAVFTVSDAAADMGAVSEVHITVDGLRVRSEGGAWTEVNVDEKTYDLLELRAEGSSALLASADLDAGTYDRMELQVANAVVVDDEGEHEARIPSNTLRLDGELEVGAEGDATADFDVIADHSLHVAKQGTYVFAPVVQLETRSGAQAEIKPDNRVEVSGGSKVTDVRIGMNAEGQTGAGLRIMPDAALEVSGDGVIQVAGKAMLRGAVKSFDDSAGTVTIMTETGEEKTLQISEEAEVDIGGASDLGSATGASAVIEFDAGADSVVSIRSTEETGDDGESSSLRVTGTIEAVDAEEGTVTIKTGADSTVTLKVREGSEISLGGLVPSVLGLRSEVGSRVSAQYDSETKVVAEMSAEGEAETDASTTVMGVVKSANEADGAVTVVAEDGEEVTLQVGGDANVTLNGEAAALSDIAGKADAQIEARYDTETNVASALAVRADEDSGSDDGQEGEERQKASVTGELVSVSALEGAVTIRTDSGEELTLDITQETELALDGSGVSGVSALEGHLGAEVAAQYDATANTALSLEAQASASAHTSGALDSVNETAGTVTIVSEGGQEIVVEVTSETAVMLNGSAASLGELTAHAGAAVEARYDAESRVAEEVLVEAEAEGSVSATVEGAIQSISAADGTVTVLAESGENVVVKVSGETRLVVEDSTATLAELATMADMAARIEYNADTRIASRIEVVGQGQASPSDGDSDEGSSESGTVSANGTLKSVNVVTGEVTLVTEAGAQLILDVTSETRILIDGASASLVELSSRANSSANVEYDAESKTLVSINV